MSLLAVELKNPPAGATEWQVRIVAWDITVTQSWQSGQNNIAGVASFDVPETWGLPLRMEITIYQGPPPLLQLYTVQSWKPLLWDFDRFAWDGPDPTYREIFIPGLGEYFYNVVTEQFEAKVLPAVTVDAPDSAAQGDPVAVTGLVTNLVAWRDWWSTYTSSSPRWTVALAALDQMIGDDRGPGNHVIEDDPVIDTVRQQHPPRRLAQTEGEDTVFQFPRSLPHDHVGRSVVLGRDSVVDQDALSARISNIEPGIIRKDAPDIIEIIGCDIAFGAVKICLAHDHVG